jgi:hypothetical protein
MDITPTPEFVEAFHRVFGGDPSDNSPRTILGGLRSASRKQMMALETAHAEVLEERTNAKPFGRTT